MVKRAQKQGPKTIVDAESIESPNKCKKLLPLKIYKSNGKCFLGKLEEFEDWFVNAKHNHKAVMQCRRAQQAGKQCQTTDGVVVGRRQVIREEVARKMESTNESPASMANA